MSNPCRFQKKNTAKGFSPIFRLQLLKFYERVRISTDNCAVGFYVERTETSPVSAGFIDLGENGGRIMKTLRKFGMFAALLSLATIFAMPDLAAQTKRKPVVKKAAVRKKVTPLYTVSSGKRFYAKMNDTISSKTARVGDRFTARITEPVYANNGSLVIPQGSEVVGRVNSVKAAAKGGKPGTIDVSFVQVVLPNGKKRAINGSLTDLDSKSAKSDSEGTASGDKMKNRKLIFIGGGGAGGAILGAAIGGGKGALIGGLLGAGGGFLGERYTKGENAEVKSGTEFGIYLNQAISMPKFVEINP